MKLSEQKCENCIYSVDEQDRMECHRNPPFAKDKEYFVYYGYWPVINDDDWCGEWTGYTITEGDIIQATEEAARLADKLGWE